MELLSLIIALGSSFVYIIQSLIRFNNFSSINRIISAIIAIMCIIVFFYQVIKVKGISVKSIFIIFFMIILLLLYLYTFTKYSYMNDNYKTQLLMLGVHAIPAVLMGSLIATKDNLLNMIKWLEPIMLLYTISIVIAVLSSDILNSEIGVQALNENSLNYQTISYYIVFALAINLFIITYFDSIEQFKFFDKKIWKIINLILIFIQVFCLFSAGGRGGLILFIFFLIYYIILNKKIIFKSYKNILGSLLICIFVIVILKLMLNFDYVSIGLNRLLGFFFGGSNKISNDYRITYHFNEAIKVFRNKPILGHGLGSVFYEFNIYTHNIFTDALVEGGVIYLLLMLIIIVYFFNKSYKLLVCNYEINLVLIIFFSSFIMLLFSGYYLNETGIWFAMGYIFTYSKNLYCKRDFKKAKE